MADTPFLSELRIFSYNNIPAGWVPCNGQILPISQYTALFSLLGTTYGGNGTNTFGLPDLNGRVPMHRGVNFRAGLTLNTGQMGGEQTHKLTIGEIPNHTHQAIASPFVPDRNTPENNFWTYNPGYKPYGAVSDNPPMAVAALQQVGQDMPHNNMAPFVALNICIAIYGVYPTPDDIEPASVPWMSEIRIFACNRIPLHYEACDGQLLEISKNTHLFSILGTNYGGDGMNTVGLPDLRASAPVMTGQGDGLSLYELGEFGGTPAVSLNADTMPQHTHAAMAKESGDEGEPEDRIWANPGSQPPLPPFFSSTLDTDPDKMNAAAIGSIGGGGAHNNMMPFNTLTFCIALSGAYPPR